MKFLSIVCVLFLCSTIVAAQTTPVKQFVTSTPEPANSTLRARVYFEDTGRPVRRTNVMLAAMGSTGPGGARNALTDDEGNLVITGLKAGRYFAIINLPGIVTPLAYLDMSQDREDFGKAESHFYPIVIDGVTDAIANIGAKRGGIISGRVMYSDGDVATGVRVEVMRKTENGHTTPISNMSSIISMMGGVGFQTDDRGYFRFTGLPAGQYIVKVSQNANHNKTNRSERDEMLELVAMRPSMINTYYDNADGTDDARVIELELGQEVGNIDIVLPNYGYHRIAGKVIAAKDKLPITRARVRFEKIGATENSLSTIIQREIGGFETDEEGKFEIADLPRGKYRVTIQPQFSHFDPVKRTYGPDPAAAQNAAAIAMSSAANTAPPVPPRPRGAGAANRATAPKPEPPSFAARTIEIEIKEDDRPDETIELTHGASFSGTVETEDRSDLPMSISIALTATDSDLVSSATVSNFSFDFENEGAPVQKPPVNKKDFKEDGVAAGQKRFSVSANDPKFYVKSATAAGRDLLSGVFNIGEGESLTNIRVVLANDTGELKGKIVNGEREPATGVTVTFVPVDAAKMLNASFRRTAVTDSEGEFTINLPPMEYAILFTKKIERTMNTEAEANFAESVREAKKVKVDAKGRSTIDLTYVKNDK